MRDRCSLQARFNSADLNIAYRMDVDEYQKLCPYSESLEENWGKPPGTHQTLSFTAWVVRIHISVSRSVRGFWSGTKGFVAVILSSEAAIRGCTGEVAVHKSSVAAGTTWLQCSRCPRHVQAT